MDLNEKLKTNRIVPVIVLDQVTDAIPLCRALQAGGLRVAEITFRTPAAREAIALLASEFPDFLLGAGTLTRPEELDAAKAAGAHFGVAPGLNPQMVRHAQQIRLPFFPGIMTPTNIETALDLGCEILKFFPAEPAGGVKFLGAISGPYAHRGLKFIPTGGISAENMKDYLALDSVLAVGGSWMVAPKLIRAGDWPAIAKLTAEAIATAAH
jgi:2-dehydro-3-deoxyphosphogluconate aldolase / (4S)-4-hydroxy-2-oxoglutarate aldolase